MLAPLRAETVLVARGIGSREKAGEVVAKEGVDYNDVGFVRPSRHGLSK